MNATADTAEHPAVAGKLSTLDRFLPVWIGVAMAAGPVSYTHLTLPTICSV